MAARGNWHVMAVAFPHPFPSEEPSNCSSASTPETVPHPNKCAARLRASNRFVKQPGQLNLLRINKPLETDLQLTPLRFHSQQPTFYLILVSPAAPCLLPYLSPRSILPRVNSRPLNSVIARIRPNQITE